MEPVFEQADIPSPPPSQPPRVGSSLRPLLIEIPSVTNLVIRTPRPQQLQLQPQLQPQPQPQLQPQPQPPPYAKYITEALRFSLHLTLISLFETLFFWLFVSQSEDAALIHLVNTYAGGVLLACQTMTPSQRAGVTTIFHMFVNQTTVDSAGAIAAAERATWNGALLHASWYAVGGLGGLTITFAGIARYARWHIPWRSLVAENLILVCLLGLYEWIFFHNIVFRYKAITPAELDRLVVDEFLSSC